MRPGHLEVMVNRRTASTDGLGNPEALHEREGGQGALVLRLDACCGFVLGTLLFAGCSTDNRKWNVKAVIVVSAAVPAPVAQSRTWGVDNRVGAN
jgi:hypothetical protein